MSLKQRIFNVGVGLATSAALYGCAGLPSMRVAEAPTPAPGVSGGGGGIAPGLTAPGRGGRGGVASDSVELEHSAPAKPETIPGGSVARANATPATAADIAALVPDEPLNAVLPPPQPLGTYLLDTVFRDVLKVNYSLGPGLAQRTDVIQGRHHSDAVKTRLYSRCCNPI